MGGGGAARPEARGPAPWRVGPPPSPRGAARRTARSRIWPTAMPVRRAWERRDAGRVRSRGDSTDWDEGKARRLRRGKRCGLRLGGGFRGRGDVRADLLVDQLDQLRAEAEGALQGGAVDPVLCVAVQVVVGGGRARDRDRWKAPCAGGV